LDVVDGQSRLAIELHRDEAGELGPVDGGTRGHALGASSAAATDGEVVTAPLLGAFYRGPKPGDPPFVTEGQKVNAGQVLGLLEVMKTYHEIVAPSEGIVFFLVEDGAFVEYGQAVARVAPDRRRLDAG
jgi:biotin carboxyl carrier protein